MRVQGGICMPAITRETIYIPRTYLKLESENGLLRYE